MSYIEASYATPSEAIVAVKRLQEEGYKQENIRLVSNTVARNAFMEHSTLDVTPEIVVMLNHGIKNQITLRQRIICLSRYKRLFLLKNLCQ